MTTTSIANNPGNTYGAPVLSSTGIVAPNGTLNWTGAATSRFTLAIAINGTLFSPTGVRNTNVREFSFGVGTQTFAMTFISLGATYEALVTEYKTDGLVLASNILAFTGGTAITPIVNAANGPVVFTGATISTVTKAANARFATIKLWGGAGGSGGYTGGLRSGSGGFTSVVVDFAEALLAGVNITSFAVYAGGPGEGAKPTYSGAGGWPNGGAGLGVGDTRPGGGGGDSRAWAITSTGERILLAIAGGGGGSTNYSHADGAGASIHGGGGRLMGTTGRTPAGRVTSDGPDDQDLRSQRVILSFGWTGGQPPHLGGQIDGIGGGLPWNTRNTAGDAATDVGGCGGGRYGGRLISGDGEQGYGGSGWYLEGVTWLKSQTGILAPSAGVAPNEADVDYLAPAARGQLGGTAGSNNPDGGAGRYAIRQT